MKTIINIKPNWEGLTLRGIQTGLAELATDVHKKAVILAPVETGNLVNSGNISKTGEFEYTIKFGSSRVPYARRRNFENKKNPQSIGYLTKAADGVDRSDKSKYFRNKI